MWRLRTVFQHKFADVKKRLNISGLLKQSRIVFEQRGIWTAESGHWRSSLSWSFASPIALMLFSSVQGTTMIYQGVVALQVRPPARQRF